MTERWDEQCDSAGPVREPLLEEKGKLFRRTVQGGGWVLSLRLFTQALEMVRLFVLVWALGRARWGLLGIVLLVLTTLQTLTRLGFDVAFIHKRSDDRRYLDTMWTLGTMRGLILCCGVILSAPWIAAFFDASGRFEARHFERVVQFAGVLRDGDDPLTAHIRQRLSPETVRCLERVGRGDVDRAALRVALAADFNRIAADPDLYDEDRFRHVELSPFARDLIASSGPGHETLRVNRRLLQEAWPLFITETVLNRVTAVRVLRLLALTIILGAVTNPGVIRFQKDLNFRRYFFYQSMVSLAAAVTTIILALMLRSVWALVYGRLLGSVLGCAITYWVHPFRPRWAVDWAKAAELWAYGRWILLTTMLGFFQNYGDNLFVAKFLGTTALGGYLLAYRLSQLPATEITLLLSTVLFPAYAKLQQDRQRLREAYLKVLGVTATLSVPVAGLIFLLAPDFVHGFLGEEWGPIVPVLQLLAIKGLTHSLHATFGPVYRAVGRPGITTKLQVVRVILLCVLIYPLTARWGIWGTALTVVLIAVVMQPVGYWMLIGVIRCRVREVLVRIGYPLAATGIMVLVGDLARRGLFDGHSKGSFLGTGLLAVLTYVATIVLLDRWAGYPIVASIRELPRAMLGGRKANGGLSGGRADAD